METKKTQIGHTPTPWHIENESIDKEGRQGIRIGNPKLGVVFDMVYTGHFAADNPFAHGEFIVRAVNSHEALLDALIMALPYVETAMEDQGYKPGVVDRMVKQIRSAIAQAEGK